MNTSLVLVVALGLIVGIAGCSSAEGDGGSDGSGGNSSGADDGDDDGADDGGADDGGAGDGGADAYGVCCVNASKYRCDTKAAFDQCAGFDMEACMQACGDMDFACQDDCFAQLEESEPDPSDCDEDDSVDCDGGSASSSGSGSGGGGGECGSSGATCSFDSDCCDDKCFDGLCYDRGGGSQCDWDSDCDSGECDDTGFCTL